jgi:RecJ-like exonuclease
VISDLILLTCPHCSGEGYLLWVGGPAKHSVHADACMPSEGHAVCPHCDGTGELEGCARCQQPLEIYKGREVCGCVAAELRHAA